VRSNPSPVSDGRYYLSFGQPFAKVRRLGSQAAYAAEKRSDKQPAQTRLQHVDRAPHSPPATVEHVGVDHGRLHALMPQKLLHRPDVVAVHQQVRGEGVPQGMAGRRLGDAGLPCRVVEGPLQRPLVQVVAPVLACARIARDLRRPGRRTAIPIRPLSDSRMNRIRGGRPQGSGLPDLAAGGADRRI
jgi:hypothetical protein